MNTLTQHDLPTEDYRAHLRPKPWFVLLCTILAGALLSILLYKIAAGAFLPDFPVAPASVEQTTLEETASEIGESAQDQSFSNELLSRDNVGNESSCAVSSRFSPAVLQWCELITRYANKRGLPPDLVAALIWQESGGNPLAYSSSGAVGLMQVMPRDGLAASFACVNGPCFSDRPTTRELQDPEYNIAYGTKLLAILLRRHGDLREALKFYGPKDVGYYYADKVFGLFQRYGAHSS